MKKYRMYKYWSSPYCGYLYGVEKWARFLWWHRWVVVQDTVLYSSRSTVCDHYGIDMFQDGIYEYDDKEHNECNVK